MKEIEGTEVSKVIEVGEDTNMVVIKEGVVVGSEVEAMVGIKVVEVMDTKEAIVGTREIMGEATKTEIMIRQKDPIWRTEDTQINIIIEVKVAVIIMGNKIDIEVYRELGVSPPEPGPVLTSSSAPSELPASNTNIDNVVLESGAGSGEEQRRVRYNEDPGPGSQSKRVRLNTDLSSHITLDIPQPLASSSGFAVGVNCEVREEQAKEEVETFRSQLDQMTRSQLLGFIKTILNLVDSFVEEEIEAGKDVMLVSF